MYVCIYIYIYIYIYTIPYTWLGPHHGCLVSMPLWPGLVLEDRSKGWIDCCSSKNACHLARLHDTGYDLAKDMGQHSMSQSDSGRALPGGSAPCEKSLHACLTGLSASEAAAAERVPRSANATPPPLRPQSFRSMPRACARGTPWALSCATGAGMVANLLAHTKTHTHTHLMPGRSESESKNLYMLNIYPMYDKP